MIKPRPLKPPAEGGFTLDDFTVNETAHTVTCPIGLTRYLGTARNNAWLKHRTAALNLRNLIGRGLTRDNGAWVLA